MKTKRYTYLIHILLIFFLISFSNLVIAQGLTAEEVAKLTKEEKVAKLNHLENERLNLKNEIINIDQKLQKLKDHYLETKYSKTKVGDKTQTEVKVIFVKKDEILKKAEKMIENGNINEAEVMIKEYEDRSEYYEERWKKQAEKFEDDIYDSIDKDIRLLEESLEKESTEEKTEEVDLAGTWYCYYAKVGSKGSECSIVHSGNKISFTNEFGNTSNGEFINKNQVKATDWENGLIGNITEGAKRINWKNGSYWVREKE